MPPFVMRAANNFENVRFVEGIFKADKIWLGNQLNQPLRQRVTLLFSLFHGQQLREAEKTHQFFDAMKFSLAIQEFMPLAFLAKRF